ncbi:MAG: thiamine phosphate synthase [Chitinophagales bacterium]|nr:thiamine phosphate synthase [Chitinophagales bacterium]
MISRFHYLTQDLANISHQALIQTACENSIDWIQLRIKDKDEATVLQIAQEAKQITNQYNTTLIINDFVTVAKTVDAHGVHLGKNDMSILAARKILGDDKIIGATANTIDDIIQLAKLPINYIGLGPFRFTSTKKQLSPILGIDGYKNIIEKINKLNIDIPIIAIGGINFDDVNSLLATGIHGIAVSSAINLSKDRANAIQSFLLFFD